MHDLQNITRRSRCQKFQNIFKISVSDIFENINEIIKNHVITNFITYSEKVMTVSQYLVKSCVECTRNGTFLTHSHRCIHFLSPCSLLC